MFKKIRWKLTLWYAGLLAVILIVLGVALYQALEHSLMTEAIRTAVTRAQQISAFIDVPETSDTGNGEGTFVDIADPDLVNKFSSEGIYIEISDQGGQVVNHSFFLEKHRLSESGLLSILKSSAPGTLEIRSFPDLGRMVVYSMPLSRNGQSLGTVKVVRSLTLMDRALDRLQLLLWFLSGGGLILAIGVGAALAKAALSPIDHITKTARQIRAEGLNRRLNLSGPNDEITRLANAFDEMLDRLETAFQRERQFTADVSHELRTPLTVIKGTAEVALRGNDPQEYAKALTTVDGEVDRMSNIINALLTLARADAGQQQLETETVNMKDLVEDACATFTPLAAKKGISLDTEAGAAVEVYGDQERLRQLLHNLVANAVNYTPRGGVITISLGNDGDWAKITVIDTGIGVPAGDLPHIFERFFRVDRARSRAEGGAGLGLSIVKWIAEAHGGKVDVRSEVGKGSEFTVWLPSATPPTQGDLN